MILIIKPTYISYLKKLFINKIYNIFDIYINLIDLALLFKADIYYNKAMFFKAIAFYNISFKYNKVDK